MINSKKKCRLCECEIDKTALGLNKKLLGRKIVKFYCTDCLADYLEITVDDLLDMVEDFKLQGCALFD